MKKEKEFKGKDICKKEVKSVDIMGINDIVGTLFFAINVSGATTLPQPLI